MHTDRRRLLTGALALGAAAAAPPAHALDYPARPVRVIVCYAPGGITDVATRVICAKLSEQMGRQFYIENITGGSANIGMAQASRAAPDGYTLLAAFSSYVINPALFAHIPYDPLKDFDPISLAVTSTTVLVVNPDVPAKSVAELIALIRAHPGKYTYASAGVGTTSHLAGEQFRLALVPDLLHVPFTGAAPAMAAVAAGHTPVGVTAPTAAIPLINDGKLRPLAVLAKVRTQTMPELPTMTELGYPEIEGESFVGFVAPAGTPKDIIALLHREIVKVLATPEMKERQAQLGNDIVGSTPEEFQSRIKGEIATWARVIKAANIRAG